MSVDDIKNALRNATTMRELARAWMDHSEEIAKLKTGTKDERTMFAQITNLKDYQKGFLQ